MTPLDVFKRRVGYSSKADQDTFTGNGANTTVNLRFENVFDLEVYFDLELQEADTYEVDGEAGSLTFEAAPPDGTVVTVNYKFSPFTDAEANVLITTYGLDKAVIEALRQILANQARLRNYKQGDTEVDNSQVFKQVRELIRMYEDQLQKDESAEAGAVTIGKRNDPRGDDGFYREKDISRLYG